MVSYADDFSEVSRYASQILKRAGVGDRLPTPVDDVVACAELVVSRDVTLDEEHVGFFLRTFGILKSALQKVIGLVDLREDTIYLDTRILPQKRTFLKLHETGHKVLPWQRDTYLYLDDETTLDAEVRELFEREANRFAADVLFQLDRFAHDARDLPLALKSPLALSKRYGASAHATIHRYVERNDKACALLVIERIPDLDVERPRLRVRSVVQSAKFGRRFEGMRWPEHLKAGWPFTELVLRGRRFVEGGEFALADRDGRSVSCSFDLFNNKYNAFVFIYPSDERKASPTRIIVVR